MPDDPRRPSGFLQANRQPAGFVIPDLHGIATSDRDLRTVRVERQMLSAKVKFPLPLKFPHGQRPDRNRSVRTPDREQPAVERKSKSTDAEVPVTRFPVHGLRN